jgi:hypothetical protein
MTRWALKVAVASSAPIAHRGALLAGSQTKLFGAADASGSIPEPLFLAAGCQPSWEKLPNGTRDELHAQRQWPNDEPRAGAELAMGHMATLGGAGGGQHRRVAPRLPVATLKIRGQNPREQGAAHQRPAPQILNAALLSW